MFSVGAHGGLSALPTPPLAARLHRPGTLGKALSPPSRALARFQDGNRGTRPRGTVALAGRQPWDTPRPDDSATAVTLPRSVTDSHAPLLLTLEGKSVAVRDRGFVARHGARARMGDAGPELGCRHAGLRGVRPSTRC